MRVIVLGCIRTKNELSPNVCIVRCLIIWVTEWHGNRCVVIETDSKMKNMNAKNMTIHCVGLVINSVLYSETFSIFIHRQSSLI